MMRYSCAIFIICTLAQTLLILSAVPAAADMGSMPFYPSAETAILYDPAKVVVNEPGQHAIILWNGQEEILLLSTDIFTSEPTSLLEVIPLPAEPKVQLGDHLTFVKTHGLLSAKMNRGYGPAFGGLSGARSAAPGAPAAQITFAEKMGVHDVKVARVDHPEGFQQWVMDFFAQARAANAKIDARFLAIIGNYLNRGFRWFVFDTIETSNSVRSKQPLEFRFQSGYVFYPLEISSLESGVTDIRLTLFTPQPVPTFSQAKPFVAFGPNLRVTPQELAGISRGWAKFMKQETLSAQTIQINGKLSDMTTDFATR